MIARLIPIILVTTTTLSSAGSVKRIGGQRPIGIREKPSGLKQIGSRLSASRSKEPTLDPNEWLVYTNATLRTWTSVTATEVEATLIRFNQSQVILKSGENKPVSIARSRLSKNDNIFLTNIESSHLRKLKAKWRERTAEKTATHVSQYEMERRALGLSTVERAGDRGGVRGGDMGQSSSSPKIRCPKCHGSGKEKQRRGARILYLTCPVCDGIGFFDEASNRWRSEIDQFVVPKR